jgi:hypothetical protein
MAGKGKPKTGGRQKGKPNKLTSSAKEAFALAFEGIGGVDKLTEWARENPGDFFKLYARLIPAELTGANGEPLIPVNEEPNMLEMARSAAFLFAQANLALTGKHE